MSKHTGNNTKYMYYINNVRMIIRTRLKLMRLQQKPSHQTSTHCACRCVVKIRVCDAMGRPSPMLAKYDTDPDFLLLGL